jgi:sugar/nucleoside kinase (ribokinase family)
MDWTALATRLADADPVSLAAFPDGSVDRFFAVERGGDRVADREMFAELLTGDGPAEFDLRRCTTEPGGHAVNLAEQATALGDDATVYGHLDHPVFDGLDATAVSMGDPAEVSVLEFAEDDVLLVEDSGDIESWTLTDLRAAADGLDAALSADAVCSVNWASFPGMTDALRDLAGRDSADGRRESDGWFVFDPGDLSGADPGALREMADALDALDTRFDVTVSVNRAELRDLADALSCGRNGDAAGERADDDGGAADVVAAVRDETGVAGVALHAREAAVAATPGGRVRVPNPDVASVARRTGAGDRLDAGLARGLAADWGWRDALALGNLCGARFVATGETGDRDALADAARRLEREGCL